MATKAITRKIVFEGNTLKDVPGMNANQLKDFYSKVYPELTTATAEEKVTTTGIVIEFTTGFKSKG